MFLARKITRAKWTPKQGLSADEIPADAVTADLRTQENSLSFWQCPSESDSDVEKTALAIAAAGERVDRLDIVWLADKDLLDDGQALKNTKGRTPVTDMAAMHVDVSRLDYARLGGVARRIAAAIESKRCRRFTQGGVKSLIQDAVRQGRVDPGALNERLCTQIGADP